MGKEKTSCGNPGSEGGSGSSGRGRGHRDRYSFLIGLGLFLLGPISIKTTDKWGGGFGVMGEEEGWVG